MTRSPLSAYAMPLILAAVVFGVQAFSFARLSTDYTLVGTALFLLAIVSIALSKFETNPNLPQSALYSGWVIGPAACLFAIHQSAVGSELWRFDNPILMSLVPLWAGDTAAIFVGRQLGRRPLAPTISPKKTVEGAIGNLLACTLAAWGLGGLLGIPLLQSIACGLAAGILGQVGDLFESWIKRRTGIKDSGTLLPGHGGIMDRIDSILFTAPAVALILAFWR